MTESTRRPATRQDLEKFYRRAEGWVTKVTRDGAVRFRGPDETCWRDGGHLDEYYVKDGMVFHT